MTMQQISALATLAYPTLASVFAFWVALILAEMWMFRNWALLPLLLASMLLVIVFGLLSLSTGLCVVVSFASIAGLVRLCNLLAGLNLWVATLMFAHRRWRLIRSVSAVRDGSLAIDAKSFKEVADDAMDS
ncbi:MAG: hypothetical protein R3A10_08025 [Caldilineaceae bacterium]